MQKTGIIFDLDGTLADTLQDIAFFMNSILEEKGLPIFPVDDYRYMVGSGLRNLVLKSLPENRREDPLIGECEEKLAARYFGEPVVKTVLYPGIPEMLDALAEQGIPCSILSNKSHSLVAEIAEILLSSWDFAEIWGQKEEFPKKPDPASAFAVAKKMGLEPEGMYFIGDSGIDMKTAANAGMTSIGVLWGFRDEDELVQAGAGNLVQNPEQIIEIVH